MAAIAQKSCFWPFLVVKKQLGNVVCAIYMGLMDTNRLVPWLRQSDHPIQKYHAPRAARRARTRDRHIYWIFKFSIASILESASTYQSTPVNLFSKHKLINFTQTGLSKSCAARAARRAARARGTGQISQPFLETMTKWNQYIPFLGLTIPVCHFKIGFKCLGSTILQLQVHLCPKFECASP